MMIQINKEYFAVIIYYFHLMNDTTTIASSKAIAIACNPVTGSGRAIVLSDKISKKLKERFISHCVFKEDWPPDFNGFSEVWIVGGDGTINYFINKYRDLKLPLSLFKGGSGNDTHWLLYGDKDFEGQIEDALSEKIRPIDAGRCNGRLFINGVGVGFEGAVAESAAGKRKSAGTTSYFIAVLKKIFFYRSKKYDVTSEELGMNERFLMISVSNGKRAGGGFYIAPAAEPDDGLLDVTVIKAISPFNRLRWLPVIEKGKHLHLPFVTHFRTRSVIITGVQPVHYHLDGEVFSEKRLEIEILPAQFFFR